MKFTKNWKVIAPTACAVVMLMSAGVMGQSTKSAKTDTATTAAQPKLLKPQTTCPVSGDPIDKKLYVDHNGKRIYLCCTDCLASVKKAPEKYIRKLEALGQSVETVGKDTGTGIKDATSDSSGKKMEMKGMHMAADSVSKTADAGSWTCPMHPEVHKTTSGSCPICGMNLVYKKATIVPQK